MTELREVRAMSIMLNAVLGSVAAAQEAVTSALVAPRRAPSIRNQRKRRRLHTWWRKSPKEAEQMLQVASMTQAVVNTAEAPVPPGGPGAPLPDPPTPLPPSTGALQRPGA